MCIFKRLGQKHRSLIKKKVFLQGGGIVWGRQPPADCRRAFSSLPQLGEHRSQVLFPNLI